MDELFIDRVYSYHNNPGLGRCLRPNEIGEFIERLPDLSNLTEPTLIFSRDELMDKGQWNPSILGQLLTLSAKYRILVLAQSSIDLIPQFDIVMGSQSADVNGYTGAVGHINYAVFQEFLSALTTIEKQPMMIEIRKKTAVVGFAKSWSAMRRMASIFSLAFVPMNPRGPLAPMPKYVPPQNGFDIRPHIGLPPEYVYALQKAPLAEPVTNSADLVEWQEMAEPWREVATKYNLPNPIDVKYVRVIGYHPYTKIWTKKHLASEYNQLASLLPWDDTKWQEGKRQITICRTFRASEYDDHDGTVIIKLLLDPFVVQHLNCFYRRWAHKILEEYTSPYQLIVDKVSPLTILDTHPRIRNRSPRPDEIIRPPKYVSYARRNLANWRRRTKVRDNGIRFILGSIYFTMRHKKWRVFTMARAH